MIRCTDDKKIWEMAKRGGYTLNISGRQELQEKFARVAAAPGWS
jgi:hypothetical protein